MLSHVPKYQRTDASASKNLAKHLSIAHLDSLHGHSTLRDMPKMIRKSDLPQKTCATCGRPFTWRKKWEKVWEEVRYCSDRCRAERKQT
jgi:hypothetical protein